MYKTGSALLRSRFTRRRCHSPWILVDSTLDHLEVGGEGPRVALSSARPSAVAVSVIKDFRLGKVDALRESISRETKTEVCNGSRGLSLTLYSLTLLPLTTDGQHFRIRLAKVTRLLGLVRFSCRLFGVLCKH
jgi:hypothetical protein